LIEAVTGFILIAKLHNIQRKLNNIENHQYLIKLNLLQ